MRALVAAGVIAFMALFPKVVQDTGNRTNPGSTCGDRSPGLPDFYDQAVLKYIEPPNWKHSLVRIAVGGSVKLDLWTDGERFKLWTDTLVPENVTKFLLELDQSCRLPADPAEAAHLIKTSWQSADLTASEFMEIHHEFTTAASRYVGSAQGTYDSMMRQKATVIYLDSTSFPIVYDSGFQHIELEVWNDPKAEQPILEWVFKLKRLAEDRFHRPIWNTISK
jgi:hypothetical protein